MHTRHIGQIGLLLAAVALPLIGVSHAATLPGAAKPTIVLTDQDNRKEVTLDPGQKLSIQLSQNPSTGWSWAASDVPDDVLKAAGKPADRSSQVPAVLDAQGKPAVVAPGTPNVRVWNFVATGAKTSSVQQTLRFEYRPWWSADFDTPGKVVFFHVVVRAADSRFNSP